jgi:hypothetical protein
MKATGPHPFKPPCLYRKNRRTGTEEPLTITIGGARPSRVRDARAVARNEVIAQVLLVNGPDKLITARCRLARFEHFYVGFFADVKKAHDRGMTVEQFFDDYAALSMGDDEGALAAVYAPSFFVGGPQGSMTFANDARFLEWLAHVRAFNRQHGMRAISPAAVRETVLSPLHVLAQVRWSVRFEKTGARAIEFEIAYLLERAEESWRLLGYISARDQQEEMQALGSI